MLHWIEANYPVLDKTFCILSGPPDLCDRAQIPCEVTFTISWSVKEKQFVILFTLTCKKRLKDREMIK